MKASLQAHNQCLRELKERIVVKPKPTKEELFLGAYLEMLEPQVRGVVRIFNRKGYTTWSSWFYGRKQAIDGFFRIDPKTKGGLKSIGVNVRERKNGYTVIEFTPKKQHLPTIKKQWQLIANLLPKKRRGDPSDTIGASLFRKNPLREMFYMIGELEYLRNRENRGM